jgi:hypothetical protein
MPPRGKQEVRIERLRDDLHGAELACDLEEIGVADAPATEMATIFASGLATRISVIVWMPSWSGMMMSVMTRSGYQPRNTAIPCRPFTAHSTWWPASSGSWTMVMRAMASSSMSRIVAT